MKNPFKRGAQRERPKPQMDARGPSEPEIKVRETPSPRPKQLDTPGEQAVPLTQIKTITFSDGTAVTLPPGALLVICGPNNAGKSAALREIRGFLGGDPKNKVIKKVDFLIPTSDAVFTALRTKAALVYRKDGDEHYSGIGYDISESHLRYFFSPPVHNIGPIINFCTAIFDTEGRISGSNPPKSIPVLRSPPKHPIHSLQRNENLVDRLSHYFRRSFGADLIIHFGAGGEVPLFVGSSPTIAPDEHPLSSSYVERLEQSAVPLQDQGDGMRSFATVMLGTVVLQSADVIFLDEPEAFLHPPQARLLGQFLAAERRRNAQTIIATHSADILRGILSVHDAEVIILRLDRSGGYNTAASLSGDVAAEIASEPLTKYSNILDGIFHRRVIACEADTDSAFYSAILDAIEPDAQADILFTHGNGKSSLSKIVRSLRALHTPISVIVDIDILNDEKVFRDLFQGLGGDWAAVEVQLRRFKTAVDNKQNYLKVGDVKEEISKALAPLRDKDPLTFTAKETIVSAIRQASPWDALKTAGRMAVPAGQMIQDFDLLLEKSGAVGLWIVPVGELESFCKTKQGGHGPGWFRAVLEDFDLAAAPELASARDFVRRVYSTSTTGAKDSDSALANLEEPPAEIG